MANKQNKSGKIIFIIVLLILLAIAAFVIIKSGALAKAIDPCEKEFSDCNHECGEGILSSLCKEKCSYDYRVCKEE